MAVVRGGTANVWSKEVKLPRKPADAVRLLATGERRVVDLGRAVYGGASASGGGTAEQGRYFLLMASVGFESTATAARVSASSALRVSPSTCVFNSAIVFASRFV